MAESVGYHMGELAIARDPTHPRHALPRNDPRYRTILDLGCGLGQSLMALDLQPHQHAWGLDINEAAVSAGRDRVPANVHLLVGDAHRLPFPDQHFDLVFSRVTLPYTDIPLVIGEIHRVLALGGDLWLMLHSPRMLREHLVWSKMSPKLLVRTGIVVANSAALSLFGRSTSLLGIRETVQTRRGIQRILASHRFRAIETPSSAHLIVRAQRAG